MAFDGIRILDLTHVLAGPFGAYQLAVLGADVIKIEHPRAPDQSRFTGVDPVLDDCGMGTAFQTQGGNRRTMTLDLAQAEGRAILHRLAADADVVMENYRPGALAALGCGASDLAATNPRLIYCSISAFGQTGARSGQTAYDLVIQATSGLMAMNGTAQTGPLRLGAPVIDYATGMTAAFAVATALFARTRTGRGDHLDVAMADVARLLMSSTVTGYLHDGSYPKGVGNRLALATQGLFATADATIVLAANNMRQQRRLWTMLERPDLIRTTPAERRAHAASDRTILATLLLQQTAETWEHRFIQAGIPAARIRTLAEAMDEDRAAGMDQFRIAPAPDSTPTIAVPAHAFQSSQSVARLHTAPRPAGADTDTILREIGYAPGIIAQLRATGIV